MILFIIFYVSISWISRKYLRSKVPLQSLLHCSVSTIWHFVLFLRYTHLSLLSIYTVKNLNILLLFRPELKSYFYNAAIHSIYYFLADLIDIFLDTENKKRRIYITHHIFAIITIGCIFFDSYVCSYGILCAELGGVVHHLKNRYKNSNYYIRLLFFVFYVIIYSTTRLLMLFNTIHYLLNLDKYTDLITIFLTFLLLYQNTLWVKYNIKKFITN